MKEDERNEKRNFREVMSKVKVKEEMKV